MKSVCVGENALYLWTVTALEWKLHRIGVLKKDLLLEFLSDDSYYILLAAATGDLSDMERGEKWRIGVGWVGWEEE